VRLKMEELVPLIVEVISSGASFKLYPNGQSMLPTIVAGEDSVELSKPDEKLKKYDIVLYKRDNGQYVLHRLLKEHGEYYDMCGDNQLEIEKNVRKSDVIAVATAIYKGDKCIKTDSMEFIKYAKKMYCKKSVQRVISHIKKVLSPAYRFIFKK